MTTISTRSAPTTRRAATAKTRTSPAGEACAAGGFTLLELLVVLVLLAVLAGIAGTRMVRGLEGPQLQAASGELSSMLRRARSRAIVENRPVTVRVDVDAPSFSIAGERPYAVPERLRLTLFTAASEQLAANVGEIRFFPDGSSTGGEVTIAAEKARQFVQVDWLTGRVRVYEQ